MGSARWIAVATFFFSLGLAAGPAVAQFGDWPDIFDPFQLRVLQLEMEPGDWATVQADESLSIEVPAFFNLEGETPILVSVRRKSGDPLTAAPGYTKVSLKIDINDFVNGQTWHGLKKLSLENGDDNNVVTEGMAWQVERLASGTQGYGYPVGYFAWVRLFINGVDTGVYVNVEQPDKRFLENRLLFAEGATWLYKDSEVGGTPDLDVGGPQDSPTWEALCYEPFTNDPSCATPDLATHVPQFVNVKGLLTEMASDAFQANRDALLTKGKNFYFADFLDGTLRMYFPWDRDASLSSGVDSTIFPTGSANFTAFTALFDVPEFRAQYNAIFNDLLCGPWSEASLLAFVDAIEPVLSDALVADPNSKFDPPGGFDALRDWLAQRVASVTAQVEGFQPCPSVQIALNELMATNNTFLEDPDEPGEFPDWIELHNPTGETIDLGGLYLSDDPTRPTKYQIPSGVTIPPNGYRIFYADEDPEQGPQHADFKLAGTGEQVAVYDTDGVQQIDAIGFGPQFANVSYGRFPDGTGAWGFMSGPTPEAANGPHNLPPSITEFTRVPALPGAVDPVTITARVVDVDDAVAEVTLYYDAGGGWLTVPMVDDGLSGDGAAGDDVYGASIPAHPDDTVVHHYILARDTLGASRTEPVAAPTLSHAYVVGYQAPALFVNEIMADNDTVIEDPDEATAFEDWFEIYNAEATAVDLGGMYLTDNLNQPRKFAIPAGVTVPAGGHLLFWADGQPLQGPTHTGFKLNAGGEQVGLFDTDARGNVPIDARTFGVQSTDVSEGRCPDGGATWQLFSAATPGLANPSCSGGAEACCLPGGICQDLDEAACIEQGGLAQGAGSTCADEMCPECLVDDDCDDGIVCTLDTCDSLLRICVPTPFDSLCQDGAFCNGPEWCDTFTGCNPGTPPCDGTDCVEEDNLCQGTGAGSIPDGLQGAGQPLTLYWLGGDLMLTWGSSCAATDTDYAVYEGTIGSYYSHTVRLCTTGGTTGVTLAPGAGSRYYLVVPHNGASEGSYGLARPPATTACLTQLLATCP